MSKFAANKNIFKVSDDSVLLSITRKQNSDIISKHVLLCRVQDLTREALFYMNSSKFLLAIDFFEEALSFLDKKDPKILFNLASCYFKIGMFKKASSLIDEYNKIDPHNFKAIVLDSYCMIMMKNYTEALMLLNIAKSIKPDKSSTYYYSSRALIDLERYDEALSQINKAISKKELELSLSKKDLDSFFKTKDSAYASGKVEDSSRADDSAHVSREAEESFSSAGMAHVSRRNEESSRDDDSAHVSREAEESSIGGGDDSFIKNKEYASYLEFRGYLLVKMEKYEDAKKDFTKLLKCDIFRADAYCKLAWICIEQENYSVALRYLHFAEKSNPNEPLTKYYFALLFKNTLNLDRAMVYLQRLVDNGDFLEESYAIMSEIYISWRDFGKAEKYINKSLENSPENPLYKFNLAKIYFAKSQFDKAHILLEEAFCKLSDSKYLLNSERKILDSILSIKEEYKNKYLEYRKYVEERGDNHDTKHSAFNKILKKKLKFPDSDFSDETDSDDGTLETIDTAKYTIRSDLDDKAEISERVDSFLSKDLEDKSFLASSEYIKIYSLVFKKTFTKYIQVFFRNISHTSFSTEDSNDLLGVCINIYSKIMVDIFNIDKRTLEETLEESIISLPFLIKKINDVTSAIVSSRKDIIRSDPDKIMKSFGREDFLEDKLTRGSSSFEKDDKTSKMTKLSFVIKLATDDAIKIIAGITSGIIDSTMNIMQDSVIVMNNPDIDKTISKLSFFELLEIYESEKSLKHSSSIKVREINFDSENPILCDENLLSKILRIKHGIKLLELILLSDCRTQYELLLNLDSDEKIQDMIDNLEIDKLQGDIVVFDE